MTNAADLLHNTPSVPAKVLDLLYPTWLWANATTDMQGIMILRPIASREVVSPILEQPPVAFPAVSSALTGVTFGVVFFSLRDAHGQQPRNEQRQQLDIQPMDRSTGDLARSLDVCIKVGAK